MDAEPGRAAAGYLSELLTGNGAAPTSFVQQTAAKLLSSIAAQYAALGVPFAPPGIELAEYGSIEFYWNNGRRELIVNIHDREPGEADEAISFYGRTSERDELKGDLRTFNGQVNFAAWLTASHP